MTTVTTGESNPHRACAHCRAQKVRCLLDETDPDACQRCVKSGRPCIFTPLQRRKQRKRTDTRVAELEREMSAMRSLLNSRQNVTRTPPRDEQSAGQTDGLPFADHDPKAQDGVLGSTSHDRQAVRDSSHAEIAQRQHGLRPSQWSKALADAPRGEVRDVVDRGILSMATARQLFETYKTDLFAHYPMVPIPDSTIADDFRKEKPTLFLAIIAAAAGKDDADLSTTLDKEILQAYATRSLMGSEKSLEIVQALLISSVWYNPPRRFGELKYYDYIHMAATMAMDIGIGTRPLQHRSRLSNANRGREAAKDAMSFSQIHSIEDTASPDLSMSSRSTDSNPDTGSTESRRTFLACYAICVGVALSLRRPNMLRLSSYIRECLDSLERAHDALPSDRTLVAWVKLIMIAEEISTAFCFDDPGGVASITELRTQLMLNGFEKRITAWFTSTPVTDMNPSGIIMYYTIRLYLYEVTLHVDHSPEDFRAPCQMGTVQPHPQGNEIPTKVLAEAISECIKSSHGLLTTFLAMDTNSCRAMPVFSYVRVSYAAFVLAKLCLSANHPGSRIGSMVDRSALQVDTYLDRSILHVRNVVGTHRARVPAIFLVLLSKLRQWCLDPAMLEANEQEGDRQIEMDHNNRSTTEAGSLGPHIVSPRIVEYASSTDSSPQHGMRGMAMDFAAAKTKPLAGSTLAGGSIVSKERHNDSISSRHTAHATAISDGSITIPQSVDGASDVDQLRQMDMDYQFLSSIRNDYDGGLTGLDRFDDWIPDDLIGMAQPAFGEQASIEGHSHIGAAENSTPWQPVPQGSSGACGFDIW